MGDLLFYGIGNPGRQDDGIGITFTTMIEDFKSECVVDINVESNYQLNIEDAHTISNYKIVIFVDASKEDIENYFITRIEPSGAVNISTHSTKPETILLLCRDLFNYTPAVYMLHIKGFEWEFGKPLSAKALKNSDMAFKRLQKILKQAKTVEDIVISLEKAAKE